MASIVTGVCFFLATLLSPLVGMVPNEAAAPALVSVLFVIFFAIEPIQDLLGI